MLASWLGVDKPVGKKKKEGSILVSLKCLGVVEEGSFRTQHPLQITLVHNFEHNF